MCVCEECEERGGEGRGVRRNMRGGKGGEELGVGWGSNVRGGEARGVAGNTRGVEARGVAGNVRGREVRGVMRGEGCVHAKKGST